VRPQVAERVHQRLGVVHADKDYQRSHELLTKAVTMKPDFLLGRLWLGRTLSLMDSLDEAKAQYDLVLTRRRAIRRSTRRRSAKRTT